MNQRIEAEEILGGHAKSVRIERHPGDIAAAIVGHPVARGRRGTEHDRGIDQPRARRRAGDGVHAGEHVLPQGFGVVGARNEAGTADDGNRPEPRSHYRATSASGVECT